jgi:transposase
MRRHELTDQEWAVIEPLLPQNSRGVPRVDDRRVINGILWRFRTGSSWRDVPERYHALQSLYPLANCRCVGSSSGRGVQGLRRRHRHDRLILRSRSPAWRRREKRGGSADPCMGHSHGGLTTKIHALVDAEGRPVRLELTAGQTGDAPMANRLLEAVAPGATVIADKAYDTDGIRSFGAGRKAWANIPPRSIRKDTFAFSRWVYRQRNLVERVFNRIKQMRGLATRYDRRADNFMAALKLAAIRIWINAQ